MIWRAGPPSQARLVKWPISIGGVSYWTLYGPFDPVDPLASSKRISFSPIFCGRCLWHTVTFNVTFNATFICGTLKEWIRFWNWCLWRSWNWKLDLRNKSEPFERPLLLGLSRVAKFDAPFGGPKSYHTHTHVIFGAGRPVKFWAAAWAWQGDGGTKFLVDYAGVYKVVKVPMHRWKGGSYGDPIFRTRPWCFNSRGLQENHRVHLLMSLPKFEEIWVLGYLQVWSRLMIFPCLHTFCPFADDFPIEPPFFLRIFNGIIAMFDYQRGISTNQPKMKTLVERGSGDLYIWIKQKHIKLTSIQTPQLGGLNRDRKIEWYKEDREREREIGDRYR